MPSPFPGMDPYLEDPYLFPDFHHMFAAELGAGLNEVLPAPYYAQVEMREELGIVEEADGPLQDDHVGDNGPERPGRPVSRRVEFDFPDAMARHFFVEIRDARQGRKVITAIEILSPSNKRPGPDRDAYAAKQADVLESDASLVEIDLLRAGRRVLPNPALEQAFDRLDPRPDYVVFVSRAWRRDHLDRGYHAFPFGLREPLPCIVVPLKEGEPEVPLDLQALFVRTYDRSAYDRAIDYDRPPVPPLSPDDAAWADRLLSEAGLVAGPAAG